MSAHGYHFHDEKMLAHCIDAYWRTGRRVGRTIYCQLGAQPNNQDPLIGTMDSPALAHEAVECHNRSLDNVPRVMRHNKGQEDE